MPYYLTEPDLAILRELITEYKGRVRNPAVTTPRALDSASPETYIALAPAGGIPALVGTGSMGDPGYADCDIYKITDTGTSPTLVPVTGLSKVVYNLTDADISSGTWISVIRDKYGSWIATSGPATPTTSGSTLAAIRLTNYPDPSNAIKHVHPAKVQVITPASIGPAQIALSWSDGEDCWAWAQNMLNTTVDLDVGLNYRYVGLLLGTGTPKSFGVVKPVYYLDITRIVMAFDTFTCVPTINTLT